MVGFVLLCRNNFILLSMKNACILPIFRNIANSMEDKKNHQCKNMTRQLNASEVLHFMCGKGYWFVYIYVTIGPKCMTLLDTIHTYHIYHIFMGVVIVYFTLHNILTWYIKCRTASNEWVILTFESYDTNILQISDMIPYSVTIMHLSRLI